MNRQLWIKALVVLAVIWAVAWAVTTAAAGRKATAERFIETYEESSLTSPSGSPSQRKEDLQRLASVVNKMDLRQREQLRATRRDGEFFDNLNNEEKRLWIDLTVTKSMEKMMEALDAMPKDEREAFVKKGLTELEKGPGKEDIERLRQVDPDLLDRITEEGLSAYFQKAGADTKMDLAPLMEAMGGVLQGIRGNEFDPANR